MRTERWIDIAAILGIVWGLVFLIVFFLTLLPLFLWLMSGGLLVAGALWRWREIRRIVRSLQESENIHQKNDAPKTRIWRMFIGIALLFIAVLIANGVSNLHQWWGALLGEPFVGGFACFGIALIIRAVRPQIQHKKTPVWIKQAEKRKW